MAFFENGLKAKVMSTELIIEANVSQKILFECLDLAKAFESKYSAYKEDSLLCQINNNAGLKAIECSASEIEIFQRAYEMAELSGGVFEPTIGVLSQGTYGFGMSDAKVPTQKELNDSKKLVNYKNLLLSSHSVYLSQKGMKLDLGGIGKGFVADKIAQQLQTKGATKALINVGGELVTFGKEYNIAIRDPYSANNLAVIKTSKNSLSISTSGDYERFIGSKEHHHILDYKTAKSNHHYSSLTVLRDGADATLLDGVATIAFNSKQEDLKEIAKQYGVAIIAVCSDSEIYFENLRGLELKSIEFFSL